MAFLYAEVTVMETKLITLAETAEVLGVNIRTIQRLTQEGILASEPDPEDKRKKVYPLAATVQAYIANLLEKTAGRERSNRLLKLEEDKLTAEVALKQSQGEIHKLKTDIAAGKYLPVEEVQMDYSRFFVILKKFVMAIPNRVSGMIAGHVDPVTARGIEKDISKDITGMLKSFVVAGQSGAAASAKRKAAGTKSAAKKKTTKGGGKRGGAAK
jgi:phage terminase Nu1 subunit (DNA packaging protein)